MGRFVGRDGEEPSEPRAKRRGMPSSVVDGIDAVVSASSERSEPSQQCLPTEMFSELITVPEMSGNPFSGPGGRTMNGKNAVRR